MARPTEKRAPRDPELGQGQGPGRPAGRPWRAGGGGQPRRGGRRRKPKRYTRDIDGAAALARDRFGVACLHAQQRDAIEAVLAGRDTLAVLPTGYGKSLIYQVPALLSDRPTIVVSPLIALMTDQAKALRQRNAPVVRLDSTVRAAERRAALARLAQGGSLVVLTTPETLEARATRQLFIDSRPWLLCVDEAHCISEWGHDFRPAYLRLAAERRALGDPLVLALTATATPRVRDDIIARLGMRAPAVAAAPPHRENLRLEVEIVTGGSKPERAGRLIKRLRRPGIVYCATTVACDSIWAALQKARIPSEHYHGRMKKADREAAQHRYMKPSKHLVMVATSAFGMGIDKSDIRYIVHYQVPGSLEQYVQESGRAGRDGKPSRCILLYDPDDIRIQKHLQRQGRASPAQLRKVAGAFEAWAGEDRPVAAADLALSAGVSQVITRSMCAQLEELGVVEKDAEGRFRVLVDADAFRRRTHELAVQLETQRREDEERLKALDAYAATTGCRSVFIRRYFGEADPPRCGRCDQCSSEVPSATSQQTRAPRKRRRGAAAAKQRQTAATKKRRTRRGGKRRRRRDPPPGAA